MYKWATVFLILFIVCGLFGFVAMVGLAAEFAKILFFVFLAAWLFLVIGGIAFGRPLMR